MSLTALIEFDIDTFFLLLMDRMAKIRTLSPFHHVHVQWKVPKCNWRRYKRLRIVNNSNRNITGRHHDHDISNCTSIIFPLNFHSLDSYLIFIWLYDEIDFNSKSALRFAIPRWRWACSAHMATFLWSFSLS